MRRSIDPRLVASASDLSGRYGVDAVIIARQLARNQPDAAYGGFWRGVAGLLAVQAPQGEDPAVRLVEGLEESLQLLDTFNMPVAAALAQQALDLVRIEFGIEWDEDELG